MLAEPAKATIPDVGLVLIQGDVNPLRRECDDVELETDVLAYAVSTSSAARGVGIGHGAGGGIDGLDGGRGRDKGERGLGLDTSAEVDEAVKELAGKLNSEINVGLQCEGNILSDIEGGVVFGFPASGVYRVTSQLPIRS